MHDINDLSFAERLTEVFPSPRQSAWHQLDYYNLISLGLSTFTGGDNDGTASPTLFNPTKLDTDKWAQTLKNSGSKGVIMSAKHADGFCLFRSKYTIYGVSASPYKDGKGDVVAELSASCEKAGLKFGIYISPADRHEASFGTDLYNDFFCHQLTELLTSYGKLFCVWLGDEFDSRAGGFNNSASRAGTSTDEHNGHNDPETSASARQAYDFDRYVALIRDLQPDAVIARGGPDVRWVGRDPMDPRPSEFCVCDARMHDRAMTDEDKISAGVPRLSNRDIGSRAVLADAPALCWFPAESYASIIRGKTFHSKGAEVFLTRSADNLFKLYLRSAGHNSALLLNVPPDKTGQIPKKLTSRLRKLGTMLADAFTHATAGSVAPVRQHGAEYIYDIKTEFCTATRAVIAEDLSEGQRIEKWQLSASTMDGVYNLIAKGETIGNREIITFRPINCAKFRLTITESRGAPKLLYIKIFR